MTYTIWNYDTSSVVEREASFPRGGTSEAVRKDPTNLVPNCPADLKGPNGERYGWLREIVTAEATPPGYEAGTPTYAAPDFEAGTVAVTIPAVERPLAEVKTEKTAAINAERDRRWRLGFAYDFGQKTATLRDGTTETAGIRRLDYRDVNDASWWGGTAQAAKYYIDAGSPNEAMNPCITADNAEVPWTASEAYACLLGLQSWAGGIRFKAIAMKKTVVQAADVAAVLAVDETDDANW